MHPMTCNCGAFEGQVSAGGPSSRVRCYCADCRAFGKFFGPQANVLDAQGGTEIVQVAQSRVRITSGIEQLAAIRLSEKGMIRWYARCCDTPVGNTMRDPRWAFVGLIHTCLKQEALDHDFGPIVAISNTQSAIGDAKPRQYGALKAILNVVGMAARYQANSSHRRTPFFTAAGEPIAVPRILHPSEVATLKATV